MKQLGGQLSLFDIVIEHPTEDISVPDEVTSGTEPIISKEQNLCPYPMPSVNDIIKRIEKSAYQINKSQLITDILECGAISISNTVDLMYQEEREQQYRKTIHKYQPEEQKLPAEAFGIIFAFLFSVVYNNGKFGDHLGELFWRALEGLLGQRYWILFPFWPYERIA